MDTWFMIRDFLGWSALGHYLLLWIWAALFWGVHDWMYGLHRRWFAITPTQFDLLHYGGMGLYKLLVLLLFFIPFLVLWILLPS